jgi:uncharacterized protein YecE (DUF72 family)
VSNILVGAASWTDKSLVQSGWYPPVCRARKIGSATTPSGFLLLKLIRVAPIKACIEFRYNSWMRNDNQAETLAFLAGHGLSYVCVDAAGFSSSIPPVLAATSDLAVMRFHGHNNAE